MRSLGALLLLLSACLVVSAGPVPTPPDNIQVQENFNVSRVRLLLSVVGWMWWGGCGDGDSRQMGPAEQVLPVLGSQASTQIIWDYGIL